MSLEIVDCEEFGEIQIRVASLIENGELHLDPRVSGKGYLNIALSKGQIVLRATRYVGLIPLTNKLAVRVRPRASIHSLSHMLAQSGVAPVAIPAFSRGYLPRFEVGSDVEKIYAKSLLAGAQRVIQRGLMKSYTPKVPPQVLRGRFLPSETIRKHASKGIRFRHEFDQNALSLAATENIALKEALISVRDWIRRNAGSSPELSEANRLLLHLSSVPSWGGKKSFLVSEIGRKVGRVPPQLGYYRDPLWLSLLILQSSLPDVGSDGSVSLDSLIIDVSKVFEAYIRRILVDKAAELGWNIRDGNLKPSNFFTDAGEYKVQPDIVVAEGKKPLAILDAKYKLDPKEDDRYELLSFMEALNVKVGGFVCPATRNEKSKFLGTTSSEKQMSVLRFDLAAVDPQAEANKFFENVKMLVSNQHRYS